MLEARRNFRVARDRRFPLAADASCLLVRADFAVRRSADGRTPAPATVSVKVNSVGFFIQQVQQTVFAR
jgi:hypothetical protein